MNNEIKIEQKEITLTIRFKELEVLNVAYPEQNIPPKSGINYFYNLRTDNLIKFNEGLFECIINVTVQTEKDSNNNVFELTVKYVLEITNMKDYPRNEKGEWILIEEFFRNMIGISISTTRGILYLETSKIGLKDVILPVFDPKQFTKNMFKGTTTK